MAVGIPCFASLKVKKPAPKHGISLYSYFVIFHAAFRVYKLFKFHSVFNS